MWLVKDSLERRWGLVWSKLEGTEHFIWAGEFGRRDREDPMPGVEGCRRGNVGDPITCVWGEAWSLHGGQCELLNLSVISWGIGLKLVMGGEDFVCPLRRGWI